MGNKILKFCFLKAFHSSILVLPLTCDVQYDQKDRDTVDTDTAQDLC